MGTLNLSTEFSLTEEHTVTWSDLYKYVTSISVPPTTGSGTLKDVSANITTDEMNIMRPHILDIIQFASSSSAPIVNSTMFAEGTLSNMTSTSFNSSSVTLPPQYLVSDVFKYIVLSLVLLINGGILFIFLAQCARKPSSIHLSPAGLLVLNLLVSDILVGLTCTYITATYNNYLVRTMYTCSVRLAALYFVRVASHLALITVALDRFIAISWPWRYRDLMTVRRSIILIVLVWMIPVIGTVYCILNNDWHDGLLRCSQMISYKEFLYLVRVPSHLAAILCVIAIQCGLYIQLKMYEREMSAQTARTYSRVSAYILFFVTTSFVLFWLPFDIMLLLLVFNPTPSNTFKIVYDASAIVAYASFMTNACAFSYRTENIRRPVIAFCQDMWRSFLCCGQTRTPLPETQRQKKVNTVTGSVLSLSDTSSSTASLQLNTTMNQSEKTSHAVIHM